MKISTQIFLMTPQKKFLGKNILFIHSGGKKKKFTIERARKLGVNVILVNDKMDTSKKFVSHFIEADTYNAPHVIQKLKEFRAAHPDIRFDGAVTFWEDAIPVLAQVCKEFHLVGNDREAALRTRSKYEMRKRLAEVDLGNPQFSLVKNQPDLKEAIKKIGFPAIMKPAWGADSEFVVLVKNQKEAEDTLRYLLENCNENFDPIFKYNNGQFLYEEFMDGMEISLECFAQYGIPHVVGINEKQPIKPPYFVEYGDIAPGRLNLKLETEAIKLAEASLIALGVKNSLAHIEMKLTSTGPKIVEVGSRMGGDDIYFNVKHVWKTDMVELGLSIALGEKTGYIPSPPQQHVVCRYFIPETSGVITQITGAKDIQKEKDLIHLHFSKGIGDPVLVPPAGFDNMGWLVVRGRTYQEAEILISKLMAQVEINITPVKKDSVLGKTIRKNALSSASVIRKEVMGASKIAKVRNIDFDELKKLHLGIITNSTFMADANVEEENPVGKAIYEMLKNKGYQVELFDMNESPLPFRKIQEANLDFALNLCESIYGSRFLESHGAALLDVLRLPYTGNTPGTISLCMDKIKVKKILDYHDIPSPDWDYVENLDDEIDPELEYPLIVKPADMDNSCGIHNRSVVQNERELRKQLKIILEEYKSPALIEEYIEGDEYDLCVWGNGEDTEVLPLIRSLFSSLPKGYWHIYSSDVQDTKIFRKIKVEKPAKIRTKQASLLSEIALDVYNVFDCHDYAKIEMRMDKEGNPFVLEINPNPPLFPDAFFVEAARLAGYSYEELIEEIIWMAVERYKNRPPFYHLQY